MVRPKDKKCTKFVPFNILDGITCQILVSIKLVMIESALK